MGDREVFLRRAPIILPLAVLVSTPAFAHVGGDAGGFVGGFAHPVAGAAVALDSPPQAITIAEGHATLIGTAFGACTVLLTVTVGAGLTGCGWRQVGVRILGSWIAASAILVLATLLK